MTSEEIQKWIDNLKAGDKAGVYEFRGTRLVYDVVVSHRTPTGRIVSDRGHTFNPSGYIRGNTSCYADRRIMPPLEMRK